VSFSYLFYTKQNRVLISPLIFQNHTNIHTHTSTWWQSVSNSTCLVVCVGKLVWECVESCLRPMRRDRGQRLRTWGHADAQCDGHGVADVDGLAAGGTLGQPTQTVEVMWREERLRTGMGCLWKDSQLLKKNTREFNTSSTANL